MVLEARKVGAFGGRWSWVRGMKEFSGVWFKLPFIHQDADDTVQFGNSLSCALLVCPFLDIY